nr:hypothetical protein [Tanacetum cinerariifolium]
MRSPRDNRPRGLLGHGEKIQLTMIFVRTKENVIALRDDVESLDYVPFIRSAMENDEDLAKSKCLLL